jgi:low affinity Fe/Cu permease
VACNTTGLKAAFATLKGRRANVVDHKQGFFTHFARVTSEAAGHPPVFALALLIIIVWAVTGPVFAFSDTWQLIINTGTTIVTFLMVFLIQNTQNRDTKALQLKLDDLIRSTKGARDELLDLEELDEGVLDEIRADYERLAEEARRSNGAGRRPRRRPQRAR